MSVRCLRTRNAGPCPQIPPAAAEPRSYHSPGEPYATFAVDLGRAGGGGARHRDNVIGCACLRPASVTIPAAPEPLVPPAVCRGPGASAATTVAVTVDDPAASQRRKQAIRHQQRGTGVRCRGRPGCQMERGIQVGCSLSVKTAAWRSGRSGASFAMDNQHRNLCNASC